MTEHDEVAELIRKLSTGKLLRKEAARMLEKQRDEIARLRAALHESWLVHYHAIRRDIVLKALGDTK